MSRDATAPPHPDRAVDHFVFLITCGFLAMPFAAWLVLPHQSSDAETAFTTFAPFAATLVLIVLLWLVEFVERRMAGPRPGWPPALFALPPACIASGLAFAAVQPGHYQLAAGLAGAVWGTVTATIGWRRWCARASDRMA